MFRPEKAFVTIITAQKGFSRHYGSLETGVDCHFLAVTGSQAPDGVWVFPEKLDMRKSTLQEVSDW